MQAERKTQQPKSVQSQKIERFSIFLIAKNSQNSYGVKTGDYMRYRRYCTRKVNKLRKVMEYKYGNRTKFIKKDITIDKSEDKRVLQIALFNSQKYWAFANQCKFNQAMKKANKLRAKFMAVKKFKRAHEWSQKLLKVCKLKTDHVTVSQSEAYSYYLDGLYFLQKQDWKQAQTKLIACREIISDLLGNIDTMNAKVYRQKIDQIDQTIKFCNFKLSKGQDIPIEQIIEMRKNGEESLSNLISSFAQRRLKQMSIQSNNEIRFGNERYPIKDQKIIQQKSKIDLQIQNLEIIIKKVMKEILDEQLFEQLLNFFSSLIILIDEAIRMVDGHKQNVKQFTQGQIAVYKKVSLMFEEIKYQILVNRNNMIFRHSYANIGKQNKKSAPQNLAKLLSNTITIYTQYADVQKAKSQGTDGLDPQKIRSIDAKVFYYRTLRLYFVGQVYFNNQKIKQAFSLWQECQRCLQSVKNSQQQQLKQFQSLVSLEQISAEIAQNKLKCIIKNYTISESTKQKLNNSMQEMNLEDKQMKQQTEFTLYELINNQVPPQFTKMNLSDYSNLKPIQLPAKMRPLQTRAIFYDIFQSTLQYPKLDNKVQKGWFGKLFGK